MAAEQPRTRTVGRKMTDGEYEHLAAVAEQDGMTLDEARGRNNFKIQDLPQGQVAVRRSL